MFDKFRFDKQTIRKCSIFLVSCRIEREINRIVKTQIRVNMLQFLDAERHVHVKIEQSSKGRWTQSIAGAKLGGGTGGAQPPVRLASSTVVLPSEKREKGPPYRFSDLPYRPSNSGFAPGQSKPVVSSCFRVANVGVR